MILLDTNVVSEPFRPQPDSRVIAWMDAQPLETLFLSAITVAALRAGVALLPAGKRRLALQERVEHQLLALFIGRVLPFDASCTSAYATLIAATQRAGASIAAADGYIAATAVTHHLAVATRDVKPFQAAGLRVIDPWQV